MDQLKQYYINLLETKKNCKFRSTWAKAVFDDAIDLVDGLDDNTLEKCETRQDLKKLLLNGAESWTNYSWSGCALCYDEDIAKHYCTPSELKKTKNGYYRPNKNESWLDVQARALYQAACRIIEVFVLIKGN